MLAQHALIIFCTSRKQVLVFFIHVVLITTCTVFCFRLELARAYSHCVSTAWGPLLECVFALADLQALPASLTDVDDFGDAQGNPLPPSVFAKRCRDRAR